MTIFLINKHEQKKCVRLYVSSFSSSTRLRPYIIVHHKHLIDSTCQNGIFNGYEKE
ncbi:hypothetical protein HanRHA438_Chr07g0319061 [Helianthus annuus]|nr:hypothetical protein HanRHA438_Chr07g0319061 [Helianthus annuus]